MINQQLAAHYKWGDNCDSWIFCDTQKLSVKYEIMPANTSEQAHKHSSKEQFFFILSGTASFYMDGDLKVLNPTEGILVAPDTIHWIANKGDTPLTFLVISTPNMESDRKSID